MTTHFHIQTPWIFLKKLGGITVLGVSQKRRIERVTSEQNTMQKASKEFEIAVEELKTESIKHVTMVERSKSE